MSRNRYVASRRRLLRLAGLAGAYALSPALRRVVPAVAAPARGAADTPVRTSYNGRALTPAWGFNTFYAHGLDGFTEETILDAARAALRSGLWQAGYRLFAIDDGWSGPGRDAGGNLVADPAKFPSGIAATVTRLHALGFAAGIYGDMGARTCGERPGSYGFERRDARWFAAQGFDYVKMDWCTAEALDARDRYSRMSAALLASGRPMTFSICNWGRQAPWTWAPGMANSARTTSDINGIYEGDAAAGRYGSDHWACMLKNLDGNQHPEVTGPGYANDPDCVQAGTDFFATETEEVAQLHLWAVMGAPLLLGLDARGVSEATLALLTHPALRLVNQDALARQGTRVKQEPGSEAWVKPLAGGIWYAVVLFNRLDTPSAASLDWRETWQVDRAYVRNLWTREEVGSLSDGYRVTLQPHETALLQVAPQ